VRSTGIAARHSVALPATVAAYRIESFGTSDATVEHRLEEWWLLDVEAGWLRQLFGGVAGSIA
jgi:hypothetical protein